MVLRAADQRRPPGKAPESLTWLGGSAFGRRDAPVAGMDVHTR